MKCLSIWQPWASLLFSHGDWRKVYETRPLVAFGKTSTTLRPSVRLEPGEVIAIQAAVSRKGFSIVDNMPNRRDHDAIILSLQKQFGVFSWDQLPLGKVIGLVKIGSTMPTHELKPFVDENEIAFGDWSIGRVAIQTKNPLKIPPFEVKGQQGIFYIDDLFTSINSVREYLERHQSKEHST